LADSTVFLTIAQSLAVFNISKAIDTSTGKEIENKRDFIAGVVSHPSPFGKDIKPRSKEAETLVTSLRNNYTLDQGDSKLLGKF
jgi:hypothetical protein